VSTRARACSTCPLLVTRFPKFRHVRGLCVCDHWPVVSLSDRDFWMQWDQKSARVELSWYQNRFQLPEAWSCLDVPQLRLRHPFSSVTHRVSWCCRVGLSVEGQQLAVIHKQAASSACGRGRGRG
jgi:hypothetical protein